MVYFDAMHWIRFLWTFAMLHCYLLFLFGKQYWQWRTDFVFFLFTVIRSHNANSCQFVRHCSQSFYLGSHCLENQNQILGDELLHCDDSMMHQIHRLFRSLTPGMNVNGPEIIVLFEIGVMSKSCAWMIWIHWAGSIARNPIANDVIFAKFNILSEYSKSLLNHSVFRITITSLCLGMPVCVFFVSMCSCTHNFRLKFLEYFD